MSHYFSQQSIPDIETSLNIGGVSVNSRVMLAPMAGVTDVIFRDLVRRKAPESLICTEMISSNGVLHASGKRRQFILDKGKNDHPIAYQLAAHQKDILLKAAETIITEQDPDTIDLNMGCPVKKITGNFEGCALMKEPDMASELIASLVKEFDKPITVKFRLGWDANSINYKEFGQMCEAAGASMVTLHARTRAQGYAPGVRWDAFQDLKENVNIPVIGNGDINSAEDAVTVMTTYGIDGVMIGRGALGQPWVIGDIDNALKNGGTIRQRSVAEKLAICMEHTEMYVDYKGERVGIQQMRKQLPWYVKGFHGASKYRGDLTQVNTIEDVQQIFDRIEADQHTSQQSEKNLAVAL